MPSWQAWPWQAEWDEGTEWEGWGMHTICCVNGKFLSFVSSLFPFYYYTYTSFFIVSTNMTHRDNPSLHERWDDKLEQWSDMAQMSWNDVYDMPSMSNRMMNGRWLGPNDDTSHLGEWYIFFPLFFFRFYCTNIFICFFNEFLLASTNYRMTNSGWHGYGKFLFISFL